MDPATFFPLEITEQIFSQLRGKELLEATLVSSLWNRHIGASRACMKKLRLALRSDWNEFTEEAEELLVNGRRYQNVLISMGTGYLDFIYNVLKAHQQWKSVRVSNVKFSAIDDFLKFFKLFEASAEEIVMQTVAIKGSGKDELNLNFPKLKRLSFDSCDLTCMSIVDYCSSLASLKLHSLKEDRSYFVKRLSHLRTLKQLTINSELYNLIFSARFSDFSAHLDELTIMKFFSTINITSTGKNFFSFMDSQKLTLKTMRFSHCPGDEVIRLAFQMKTLNELQIFFPKFSWKALELPISLSIRTLDIIGSEFQAKALAKTILSSVPNVKHLHIYSMDVQTAQFAAKTLKHLETITIIEFKAEYKKILPHVEWILYE